MRPKVIAHRGGARHEFPENTLASIECAPYYFLGDKENIGVNLRSHEALGVGFFIYSTKKLLSLTGSQLNQRVS
jgi:hypothetical protein